MAKYLMLKYYKMAPKFMQYTPMDQWTPAEADAHMNDMNDFAGRLKETGEFVDSYDRALELAGELSAAPGAGGEPIREWLELRPFMGVTPCTTD